MSAPPSASPRGRTAARVQAIRDRTGWVYARCREVAAMTDAQIEAIVREHEDGR